VCGATLKPVLAPPDRRGLSPRVRGHRRRGAGRPLRRWSIPACAGPPQKAARTLRPSWVYPRVCGATISVFGSILRMSGLSPRVRGHLNIRVTASCPARSIPACAGPPLQGLLRVVQLEVYPRVCGATGLIDIDSGHPKGLSPRVRGHHPEDLPDDLQRGSIPACAGPPL